MRKDYKPSFGLFDDRIVRTQTRVGRKECAVLAPPLGSYGSPPVHAAAERGGTFSDFPISLSRVRCGGSTLRPTASRHDDQRASTRRSFQKARVVPTPPRGGRGEYIHTSVVAVVFGGSRSDERTGEPPLARSLSQPGQASERRVAQTGSDASISAWLLHGWKDKAQALRRRLSGAFASSIWLQNGRGLALSVVSVAGRSLYRGQSWADPFSGSILEFLYPVRYRDAARHKRQASRLTCFSNFVAAVRYRVLLSDPPLSYLKTFCDASSPKVTLVLKRPSVFVCKIRILRSARQSSNTANSGCTWQRWLREHNGDLMGALDITRFFQMVS